MLRDTGCWSNNPPLWLPPVVFGEKCHKTSAIVKSRASYTCRSVPNSVKNGAPLAIGGVGGGSMEPDSTGVRSGRLAVSDLARSAPSTPKWRLRPPKKRHLSPLPTTFLMIFAGFFSEFPRQGANWREFGPEKDTRRRSPPQAIDAGILTRSASEGCREPLAAFCLRPR